MCVCISIKMIPATGLICCCVRSVPPDNLIETRTILHRRADLSMCRTSFKIIAQFQMVTGSDFIKKMV
jgi:hypothetical protein